MGQSHSINDAESVVFVLCVFGKLRNEPHLAFDGLAPYAVTHRRQVKVVVGVVAGHIVGVVAQFLVEVDVCRARIVANLAQKVVGFLNVAGRAPSSRTGQNTLHIKFRFRQFATNAVHDFPHSGRRIVGVVNSLGAKVVGTNH